MKRKRVKSDKHPAITKKTLEKWHESFQKVPANIIARNAVSSVGSMFATTDSNRVNKISYIFMNSVKRKNLKATNQGHSGRCWMFAALNTFRHILIEVLDLENFEFSETYLFFWDKLERCNSYIQWFIDHPKENPSTRGYEYMITDYTSDGGWWNTFANLVTKYGIIPHGCMNETASSVDSAEMNRILKEHIDSCVNYITINRKKLSQDQLNKIMKEKMEEIYSILVKFLGEPPTKLDWSYKSSEGEGNILCDVTPEKFTQSVTAGLNMNEDFITLVHLPSRNLKTNTLYSVRYTNNVYEGKNCTMFNTDIEELTKYAMKSIISGFAVWFVGDVHQSFNWFYSALDDELDAHEQVFGENKFSKGDRIIMRNIQGNHAMALTGFNADASRGVKNWQVENSWGYWDNETPGLDGFLTMSHSWFKKYVMEIVVLKRFLSRTMLKQIEKEPIILNPWDSMAPATRAGVVNPPINYLNLRKKTFP